MCDTEGQEVAEPGEESRANPIEQIRELAAGINDWVYPHCTAAVRSRRRPKSRLQLRAKLLLACNIPLTGACFLAAFCLSLWLKPRGILLDVRLFVKLAVLAPIGLSLWALSMPRVVYLHCPKCGLSHHRYRVA
jgi:hypothetical protein